MLTPLFIQTLSTNTSQFIGMSLKDSVRASQMIITNCTSYFEHQPNFSKPMPWIGLYIAASSLFCGLAMLADLTNGFRYRQPWIPCRFTSLNSASLTIVAVAFKLSMDFNTSMPGKIDQLAKMSTSVLICISIAIFIPSLGKMSDTELVTNLIALMILVTTSIVNLCIQLNTGVIYEKAQVLLLGSMVYLLMVCCSTAIALASIKNELRVKYEKGHRLALNELKNGSSSETKTKRLEEYLVKFSMMSHTGWPQYVLGRSISCGTTWYLCKFDISLLVKTMIFPHDSFCSGKSDYEGSTMFILGTQIFAVVMGFMTLTLKLLHHSTVKNIRLPLVMRNPRRIESYWTQMLVEIKQRPLFSYTHNRKCRKIVHHVKSSLCNFFIAIQIAMVFIIQSFGFVFNKCASYVVWAFRRVLSIIKTNKRSLSASYSREKMIELKQNVLYLMGEEELIESMMKTTLHATYKYIEVGKREEPTHLLEFLENFHSPRFAGVFQFDSYEVPPLGSEEIPANCWSLQVVTLTSLAVLLPNVDSGKVNKLLDAVREGLIFVGRIEKNLNDNINLINIRKAAACLWEEVDNHGRHFDIELNELAVLGNNPISILEFVVYSAKEKFLAFKISEGTDSVWPIGAVSSYSLYKICLSILLDCQNKNYQYQTTNDMFEMLSSIICDILGACLTNLEHSILMECSWSTIENMNEIARRVLNLFGRTKRIMELLDRREIPNLDPKRLAFIDEWRHSSET